MSADPRLRARQQQQQQQAAPAAVPPPPPPPPAEPQPAGVDGAKDAHAEQNLVADDKFKLKFCTVCASNQNRYVASLALLRDAANLISSGLWKHTSSLRPLTSQLLALALARSCVCRGPQSHSPMCTTSTAQPTVPSMMSLPSRTRPSTPTMAYSTC